MRTYRIRPLLLFTFLLINAAYLLFVMVIIYVYMSRFVVEEASQTRQILLTEMNEQIALSMREAEGTAISIATHPILLNALSYEMKSALQFYETRDDIAAMMNHYVFSRQIFNSIVIYTDLLSGQHYFAGQAPLAPLSEYKWVKLEEMGVKDTWIGAHKDHSGFDDYTDVLSYVRVLQDRTGEFSGYLKVNIKASYSLSFGREGEENSTKLLIDKSNQVVATIDNPLGINVENILLNEGTGERRNSKNHIKLDGVSYLVVYSEPNHMDWRMIEVIPYSELFRNLNAVKDVFLVVGIIAALLSFVIAFYLSRKMTQVVSDLLNRFRQVEKGSFEMPRSKHSILELQQLYNGLQKMTKRLSMLIKRVETEQKLKVNAELHARLAQINPHFLYNTLDMINWMVIRKGAYEAGDMIGKLSKLFRISLSEGQLFILFGEELEHGRLFHELQRERYKNNIRFLQQVSHPHKTLYVPKLILQPFIENAVKHGFNGSLHHADKPMEICIHTEVKQGTFYIYIDNNGNRLSDSFMKERNETSTGYGVRNVRERIQMYFGPEYGVELRDLDAGGVRVTIKLPEVRSLEKLESYNIQNRI